VVWCGLVWCGVVWLGRWARPALDVTPSQLQFSLQRNRGLSAGQGPGRTDLGGRSEPLQRGQPHGLQPLQPLLALPLQRAARGAGQRGVLQLSRALLLGNALRRVVGRGRADGSIQLVEREGVVNLPLCCTLTHAQTYIHTHLCVHARTHRHPRTLRRSSRRAPAGPVLEPSWDVRYMASAWAAARAQAACACMHSQVIFLGGGGRC